MSSTSNITISLQTTSQAREPGPDKSSGNNGLDNETHDDGFDKALAKAQSNQSPETGKTCRGRTPCAERLRQKLK